MIEILPAPPHVAAFHCQGTLSADDYDHCIAQIETRLATHRRIAVFVDLTGLSGLTPEAMAKDLRYALSKFGEYDRFARAAIVTERDWLAQISSMGALFFPKTELRTFGPAEREAALAWIGEPLVAGN